jgi:pilus assembly protein CpaE
VVLVLTPDAVTGLQTLQEVRNMVPGAQILVAGPAGDPKLILEALKLGADEYLDQQILEAELAGFLARWQVRQKQSLAQSKTGRSIAILGPCGGCGVSTLAASISIVLAQEHGACGLLDLRLGAGDLAWLLDVQPLHNLADLCDHLAHADQTLFDQVLVRHSSGVHLLAAPIQMSDTRRVTSKGVRRALALARARFPYVIVDVGTLAVAEQLEALWQADLILLVLRLDFGSLQNAQHLLQTLVEMGIERERLRLVVNGYRQRRQLEVGQAETALGMKISHCVPYAPGTVNGALNQGVPVVLQHRFARVVRSLRSLAFSVNGAHQEPSPRVPAGPPARRFWANLTRLVASDRPV